MKFFDPGGNLQIVIVLVLLVLHHISSSERI